MYVCSWKLEKSKSLCSTILEVAVYLIGMLYLEILSIADFIHIFSIINKNNNLEIILIGHVLLHFPHAFLNLSPFIRRLFPFWPHKKYRVTLPPICFCLKEGTAPISNLTWFLSHLLYLIAAAVAGTIEGTMTSRSIPELLSANSFIDRRKPWYLEIPDVMNHKQKQKETNVWQWRL